MAKLILEPIDLDAQLVLLPRNEMKVKSALENATRHGHVHLVKILLDRCAEFDYEGSERTENYLDVISVAADFNQQAVVRVVLNRAEQRGISPRPRRALQLAAKHDHDAICRLLVKRGTFLDDSEDEDEENYHDRQFLNFRDNNIPDILTAATEKDNVNLLMEVMDTCGYSPLGPLDWETSPAAPGGNTILEMVAEKGTMVLFGDVLSWGVDLDPRNPACCRALLRATSNGQTEIVSYFLQHGFGVNDTYRTQAPGLEDDYFYGEDGLDRGITLLIQSVTPWDMFDGQWEASPMTQFLLNHGAEVDTFGSKGRTALAEAARKLDTISSAKVLVEGGANPILGLEKSESALDWAIRGNNFEMVELFLQTIAARGYQPVDVDSLIHCHMSAPSVLERENEKDWARFFVKKALLQYYWRTRYPVPDP
ncbi:hypothetical protein PoHVEF18_005160 [Penicillium ochrochloron]